MPRPKHRARGRLVMRSKRSTSRHARQGCKKGSHTFGPEQQIGGGIVRLICDECGAVSIDLREATDPVTEVPRLERRDWVVEPEPPLWGTRRGR
ncbi:MAG: hypothetical protein ACE5MI_05065 [Acidimicrobiia bacterium]